MVVISLAQRLAQRQNVYSWRWHIATRPVSSKNDCSNDRDCKPQNIIGEEVQCICGMCVIDPCGPKST